MLKIKNIEKLVGQDFLGIQRDYDCKIKTVGMSIDLSNNDTPLYTIYFETKNRVYGNDLILELDRKKTNYVYEMRNNITKGKWAWHRSDFDNMNIFVYKLGLYIENISKDIFLKQIPF